MGRMTGGGTTDSGTTGGRMTGAGMTSNVTTGDIAGSGTTGSGLTSGVWADRAPGVLANVIMVNVCSDILETEHTVLCGIYTSSFVEITRTK